MNLIFSVILCTVFFAITVNNSTKKYGKLSGKNYRLHIILVWLFLMFNCAGFQMLGWAVGHPSAILTYFYVPVGPLPAWFNLSSWAAYLIASIFSIYVAFSLARRNIAGRRMLLKFLPILYIVAVIETLKGFFKGKNEDFGFIIVGLGICAVLVAILYVPIYLFYRKEEVKVLIFNNQIENKS